jgi:hypothetical protein
MISIGNVIKWMGAGLESVGWVYLVGTGPSKHRHELSGSIKA